MNKVAPQSNFNFYGSLADAVLNNKTKDVNRNTLFAQQSKKRTYAEMKS